MKFKEKRRLQIALRRLYTTTLPNKEIISLVGIDRLGFINHVNQYRLEGMNFNDFGITWGFDHIVPVHLFNFSDEEDLKLCYNYNNIMPMFNDDNRLKGASVHFSLVKLESMYTNVYIQKLKDKCHEEINRTYLKYL